MSTKSMKYRSRRINRFRPLDRRSLQVFPERSIYQSPVNTRLPSLFVNVLELEHRSLAVVKSPKYQYDGSWKMRWSCVAATLLSMQLSDALARVKTLTHMMTFCQRCANQTLNPGKSSLQDLSVQNSLYSAKPKFASSANEFANEIKSQPDLHMPVYWTVQRYGHGWELKRATEWLAAIVISLHTLLVSAHLLIVLERRWHFDGWDGLWGFLALVNRALPLRFWMAWRLERLTTGFMREPWWSERAMMGPKQCLQVVR